MPSITTQVTVDFELDDFDADELAEALVQCSGWRDALRTAASRKGLDAHEFGVETSLQQIFDDLALRRPVDDALRRLAWDQFGRSVP